MKAICGLLLLGVVGVSVWMVGTANIPTAMQIGCILAIVVVGVGGLTRILMKPSRKGE